jgi:signal transduction histidine kinase
MTAVPDTELKVRRQAFVDGIVFRFVACLFVELIALATALASDLLVTRFLPAMLLGPPLAVLNTLYWYAGKARGFPLRDFYVHWFGDLVIISLFIYSLGGLDVPYGPFVYSMIVITSAMFMSRRGSYLVAGGAALCLVSMAVGARFGVLPPPLQMWSHHYSSGAEFTVVIGAIIFFYMNAYLAGTLSDQLKAAKAEIEDHNRLLEQRVKDRTHELEERTDELQEMVHIVTHDLQNVAVASAETARMLAERDGASLSERGQRYAGRLVRDCRLMASMLRDLLEVEKKTEVAERHEPVDVASVVREAIARVQNVVESKGIEIVIGDLPRVLADYQKIQHVFENVLNNACKYVGDKPRPRIEVGGTVENGRVEYFVRDNGIGIEATQMDRIFQLYHRAPEQTVAGVVQDGHGIGLAVVKRIVQRYGGRIWVESVPGEGSCFRLSFPREERAET